MISVNLDDVKAVEPNFDHLEESPITVSALSKPIGWHVNTIGVKGVCLGSGSAQDRETAKRIALAETIERAVFRRLRNSDQSQKFGFDKYPTTCGLAAGFEFEKTRIRSICEAVERWARALWIDDGFALIKIPSSRIFLSPLGKYLIEPFQDCIYFSSEFSLKDPIKQSTIQLKFAVVIGLTKNGAFPGSRVCSYQEDPWEHACLEAWRHHLIYANNALPNLPKDSFLGRVCHFGNKRDLALSQIERASRHDWPAPSIMLHRSLEELSGKLFVWRSLCDGYTGWQNGQIDRFVY